MTTTIRPTGPVTQVPADASGKPAGRTRHYDVCVNSRPVGTVRVTAHDRPTGRTGTVSELRIADGRRRGRGTVAALAAEEVLRGWDCVRVRADIPAEALPALALADSLGYRPTGQTMVKDIPETPPPLPDGLTAEPVDEAGYPRWRHDELAGFSAELARDLEAVGRDPGAAADLAAGLLADTLPDGHATPTATLRVLRDPASADPASADPAAVGDLWLSLSRPGGAATRGWITSLRVPDAQRRRGRGRALLALAEQECRAAGLDRIGLHVHAGNTPALRLYDGAGYRTTTVHVAKRLV